MTHLTSHDPPVRILRVALDRCTFLVSRPIDENIFKVVELLERLAIESPSGLMTLERRGKATPGAPQSIWSGDGLFIAIRRDPAIKAGIYPLRIELQGRLCSTDRTGIRVAEEMRASVLAILYPGLSDELAADTFPGRFDVCVDCAFDAPNETATEWIEQELFGAGNVDKAVQRWSTRAAPRSRKTVTAYVTDAPDETPMSDARMLGVHATGRTQYLGRNPQLRIYEKDRESIKGFDGPIVRSRWLEAGWNGKDRVVRVEWEVTREWITAQTLYLDNGPIDEDPDDTTAPKKRGRPCTKKKKPKRKEPTPVLASSLTWSDWYPLLGMILTRLTKRYRHIVMNGEPRRDRCPTSPWWQTVCDAAIELDRSLGPWVGVAELKTTQRDLVKAKALRRVVLGLTDLQLFHPADTLATIGERIGAEEDAKGPHEPDGAAPRDTAGKTGEHPDYLRRMQRQQKLAQKLGLNVPFRP